MAKTKKQSCYEPLGDFEIGLVAESLKRLALAIDQVADCHDENPKLVQRLRELAAVALSIRDDITTPFGGIPEIQ